MKKIIDVGVLVFYVAHVLIRRGLAYGVVLILLFGPPFFLSNVVSDVVPFDWNYLFQAIFIVLFVAWLVLIRVSPIEGIGDKIFSRILHPDDWNGSGWGG